MELPPHLRKTRLTTEEASQYLEVVHGVRIAKITLSIRRCKGGGPAFQKFGPRVLYTPAALDEWALATLGAPIKSTSEIQASTA
ncbi:hypothetical protein J5J86_20775 [Aquabacter sp. L1I39]|uniref:hypothetical protein n=1 Tax=Aquabacter sp. L1I39 TaxID=2820278 RepID=UPI001ADA87A0|nr:hypothetical protein [Aquabacter sp. L1I39]QTL03160.1 hypothetical protein J5J86_20775 [Aquabacter sp. L1I39]